MRLDKKWLLCRRGVSKDMTGEYVARRVGRYGGNDGNSRPLSFSGRLVACFAMIRKEKAGF